MVWVTVQHCLDVIAIQDEKVFHELEVGKVVVGLVMEEFQVLFVHHGLHRLGNGGDTLECLCSGEGGREGREERGREEREREGGGRREGEGGRDIM